MSEENKPVEGIGALKDVQPSNRAFFEPLPSYNVGDTVLFVLSGESKPVGGVVKEVRPYGEVVLTIDGIDWNISQGFIVRSAVTSPAALKDALASVNPSKSLGKSEKRAFDGSDKQLDREK